MEIDRANPKRKGCFRCGSLEHMVRDCPLPPPQKVCQVEDSIDANYAAAQDTVEVLKKEIEGLKAQISKKDF